MDNKIITISLEQQFGEVLDIILQHQSRATAAVNEELCLLPGMWADMYLQS